MSIKIQVDTAVEVFVNVVPLTDSTDFITIEDNTVAYNQAGMDLNWNFITTAGVVTQTNVVPTVAGNYDWAHVGNGMYKIEIPASGGVSINNDTEGVGWFSGICTGVLAWVSPQYEFIPAVIANSLVNGTDYLQTDVIQIEGTDATDQVTTATTASLNSYDPPTNAEMVARTLVAANYFDPAVDTVANVTTVATLTGHTPQTGDSFARIGATGSGLTSLATQASVNTVDGIVDAILLDTGTDGVIVATNNDKTGYSISGTLTTLDALMAKVLKYLQLMVRKDAAIATDNATELTAINANGGSGVGSFSNQTDSEEALRDHIGDGTNLTEAGGTGDHLTAINLPNQTMDITGNITGNLSGSVGSVVGGLNTGAGVITTLDGLDTAQDVQHTATQADTQDIQTRLPAALIGGRMNSDATAISGSPTAADQLEASAETIVSGSAIAGTLSTTQMSTDLTEATDNHYNGRVIIWTSGVLQNQATAITNYDGPNKILTFTAVTEAPSANDTFVLV